MKCFYSTLCLAALGLMPWIIQLMEKCLKCNLIPKLNPLSNKTVTAHSVRKSPTSFSMLSKCPSMHSVRIISILNSNSKMCYINR